MSDPIARLREWDEWGEVELSIQPIAGSANHRDYDNALPALLDYVEALEGWPDLFGDAALAAKQRLIDARAALSRALGMEEPT